MRRHILTREAWPNDNGARVAGAVAAIVIGGLMLCAGIAWESRQTDRIRRMEAVQRIDVERAAEMQRHIETLEFQSQHQASVWIDSNHLENTP